MTDSEGGAPSSDEEYQSEVSAVVGDEHAGLRADKTLAVLFPQFSRSRLKSLIENGDCLINGQKPLNISKPLRAGDRVDIIVPAALDCIPQPENIPLDIVFEDKALIVVNKPAGMVVHPAAGNWTGTLVNALLYHCGDTLSGINGVRRPGIVHRLDKETTGLMIVAKTDQAHHFLSAQLQDRSLSRVYVALVSGAPFPAKGEINYPLGRHPSNRLKMAVVNNGREALTFYQVLKQYGDAVALVECRLATGRTHQIRAHFEKIRHPLVGDPLYGPQPTSLSSALKKNGFPEAIANDLKSFPRQALHARALSFIHPVSLERRSFEVALPCDMAEILRKLDECVK